MYLIDSIELVLDVAGDKKHVIMAKQVQFFALIPTFDAKNINYILRPLLVSTFWCQISGRGHDRSPKNWIRGGPRPFI